MAEILNIEDTFYRYRLDWMGEPFRSYSLVVMYEFYASYDISINLITLVGKRAQYQPSLAHTLVRGSRVDLYNKKIWRFLFVPGFERTMNTIEFDFKTRIIRSRRMMKDPN